MSARTDTAGGSKVAAVVLAAGAGTRFGGPKQRLLLPRVLERLRQAEVGEIVVVSGAYPLEAAEGARVVQCPDWERGPGASLACGLRSLGREHEAAVVVLADGPNLVPAAIRRVVQAWRTGLGDVIAASYADERGHPVVLARSAWERVPAAGMKALPAVLVPCDDLGSPGDVDTADDIGALHPPLNGN